jgi:hypothetical protein
MKICTWNLRKERGLKHEAVIRNFPNLLQKIKSNFNTHESQKSQIQKILKTTKNTYYIL